MGVQAVLTGTCQCAVGSAPSPLMVLPIHRTMAGGKPAANIKDHIPFLNIMPFGSCALLLGAPCVPATPGPWAPGSPTVLVDGAPALNNSSILSCCIGGVISITNPGQPTVLIP